MRKDNKRTKNNILKKLSIVEFTHTYAFAIREDKMVKAVIVENADEVLPFVTYCERNSESHGADWGVRMLGTVDSFEILIEYAKKIITICSLEEFEEELAERKECGFTGNRGDLFEHLFAKATKGKMPKARNAKCTESGDVIVRGKHIQCKLWNATITTKKQVDKFYNNYKKFMKTA